MNDSQRAAIQSFSGSIKSVNYRGEMGGEDIGEGVHASAVTTKHRA